MAVRKLDFLYCGSANDSFFAQIAFARLCLDALGGDYRDARVVAALAEYETPEVPARWQPYFERIEVIWANPDGLPNDGWFLQHYARYPAIRDDADLAVISDADVCVLRPFDRLIDELIAAPAIAGVIAHYHFPLDGQRGDPDADWSRIAQHALGRDVARPHRYLYGRDPYEPRIHDAAARPPAPFGFDQYRPGIDACTRQLFGYDEPEFRIRYHQRRCEPIACQPPDRGLKQTFLAQKRGELLGIALA